MELAANAVFQAAMPSAGPQLAPEQAALLQPQGQGRWNWQPGMQPDGAPIRFVTALAEALSSGASNCLVSSAGELVGLRKTAEAMRHVCSEGRSADGGREQAGSTRGIRKEPENTQAVQPASDGQAITTDYVPSPEECGFPVPCIMAGMSTNPVAVSSVHEIAVPEAGGPELPPTVSPDMLPQLPLGIPKVAEDPLSLPNPGYLPGGPADFGLFTTEQLQQDSADLEIGNVEAGFGRGESVGQIGDVQAYKLTPDGEFALSGDDSGTSATATIVELDFSPKILLAQTGEDNERVPEQRFMGGIFSEETTISENKISDSRIEGHVRADRPYSLAAVSDSVLQREHTGGRVAAADRPSAEVSQAATGQMQHVDRAAEPVVSLPRTGGLTPASRSLSTSGRQGARATGVQLAQTESGSGRSDGLQQLPDLQYSTRVGPGAFEPDRTVPGDGRLPATTQRAVASGVSSAKDNGQGVRWGRAFDAAEGRDAAVSAGGPDSESRSEEADAATPFARRVIDRQLVRSIYELEYRRLSRGRDGRRQILDVPVADRKAMVASSQIEENPPLRTAVERLELVTGERRTLGEQEQSTTVRKRVVEPFARQEVAGASGRSETAVYEHMPTVPEKATSTDISQSSAQHVHPRESSTLRSIVDQIATGMSIEEMSFEAGPTRQQVTIGLEPESLGKVEVQLELENGRLVANLAAETAETRRVLRLSVDRLVNALKAQGLEVAEVRISESQASQPNLSNNGLHNHLALGQSQDIGGAGAQMADLSYWGQREQREFYSSYGRPVRVTWDEPLQETASAPLKTYFERTVPGRLELRA